jgi:6-phosphogluconolactonase (cycloisomerase 2 family)
MKLSLYGRLAMALLASVALGLGMTACGGGTIGYVWVLGQQYNQIAGFKVDDFTGNLTSIAGSPVSANGTNPVMMAVKPGGRFVYVINQGTGGGVQTTVVNGVSTKSIVKGTSSGISVFSVGGDGALTFLSNYESQGSVPVWAQFDGGGTFLYVLDKYSPDADPNGCSQNPIVNCNGSVTVFQTDPNTGRLTLVQNTQSIPPNSAAPTFFEVGQNPIMMKTTSSCLLTLNANVPNAQSISPYSINSSTGQLSFTGPQTQALNTVTATSINGNGTYTYITDSQNGTDVGMIYPFTIASNCNLTAVTGGAVKNFPGTLNPVYSLVDISNKYLYILNQSTTSTTVGTAFSSMSAWTINPTNGQLAQISGAPFVTGAGPVCMVEDASSQYIYVSNHNDGTVTGKVIDPTTGNLSALSRGSTFTATGQATCLGFSGAVN